MWSAEITNRQEFVVKNGCHDLDGLIIVLSGSFRCTISGRDYVANKDDIFVFNCNSPFQRNVIVPMQCIYIQFDAFPAPLEDGIMKIQDYVRMKSTISCLEQAIRDEKRAYINHFIEDLFILHEQSRDCGHGDKDTIVSACMDFFADNYSLPINLDILAAKFNISKQALIAKFKKHTKKTPMEYLNELRLLNGKTFLVDTDMSIGEIANKCGFENVYYFSNTFKKHVGTAPSLYRKKFQL